MFATFYSFYKRINSTKRPGRSDAGRLFEISLKSNCNLNNPDIILRVNEIPDWNYIHIPDIKRYYFVDSWEYVDHSNWVCHCTVDALASWKEWIGNSTMYVARSASDADGYLVDMLYPAKSDVSIASQVVLNPWINLGKVDVSAGCFVIGCDSKKGGFGSVRYYAVDQSTLEKLCAYLTTEFVSEDQLFNSNDASIALQNSLVNPMQFIRSAYFFPFDKTYLSGMVTNETIEIYDQKVTYDNSGVTAYLKGDALTDEAVFTPQDIPMTPLQHPQAAENGQYMNCSPFTKLQLNMPPFGCIELDPTIINTAGQFTITQYIDLITGKEIIEINVAGSVINRLSTQLGVPIQLSQVTRNYIQTAQSGLSSLANLFTGNVIGAFNGIGNALQSAAPRVNSVGSNGGFADLYGDIELVHTFYIQAEKNTIEHGNPLMKYVQLGTLTGYIEVEKPDIDYPCTTEEKDMLIAYMSDGFFYE